MSFNLRIKPLFLVAFACIACKSINAQNIDLGNLKSTFSKKNALKLSGGLNATALTFGGNDGSTRDPLNWFIQGNLNINLFGQFDIPLSLNLTNAGTNLQLPNSPNRIGLHPTYKWITAHIGDVAMTFSPYTLSGHQFTGLGVDLAPKGNFRISAMYGRLQNAVELDTLNTTSLPAYKRMGNGIKVVYTTNNKKAQYGVTVFTAKDDIESLAFKPDSLQILPQQNFVTSFNTSLKPTSNTEFIAEYAISALTRDIRDTTLVSEKSNNILASLINAKNSTGFFNALKMQFNFHLNTTVLGVGYERVDPGYKTLGAYFFANDLENFTVNFSRSFFKNTTNFSANFGVQRDNLDNAKSGENKRYIMSSNLSIAASKKVFANLSYSNFQTFMNIRPIFQLINQVNTIQNLDTLNFSQISQNANLNVNVITKKSPKASQNLNMNLSYQNAVDVQGGIKTANGSTEFYNATLTYNFSFIPSTINFNASYNYSYNKLASVGFTIQGPIVGISSRLFKKTVTLSLVSSFNSSSSTDVTQPATDIYNTRFNATYTFFKKHNLTLGANNQKRVIGDLENNIMLGNLAYSFNF